MGESRWKPGKRFLFVEWAVFNDSSNIQSSLITEEQLNKGGWLGLEDLVRRDLSIGSTSGFSDSLSDHVA
jgi:hypothetical protein